ncbi:MAG: carboxypeptidase regulatory-like domain-containing protein [Thermoplasmatales archaeon]|nr:carboxypeptidase regulatory-like domain-containing protein [Thermoplasmatales archaeon]
MKKIYTIIIAAILCATILCATITSCSAKVSINTETLGDEWTGYIRIEGKDDIVWADVVTVDETYFNAKNVDTGEIEEYYISFPSVLGALVEASDIGSFYIFIEYWPAWDAFLVKTIGDDSDWWHYLVDYEVPMVGTGDYELTEDDEDILFGYLEQWEVNVLKISLDKEVVKKNEEFTVTITNLSDGAVEGATVYINSETYTTDENGEVTATIGTVGSYKIYAEKENHVRSEKLDIYVKVKNTPKRVKIILNFLEVFPKLEKLLQPLLNFYM